MPPRKALSWLLLILGAGPPGCGDNLDRGPSGPDGGGGLAPVAITVNNDGSLQPDVYLMAQDSEGRLTGASAWTDGDGRAVLEVPPGGMVTAARTVDGSYWLDTVVAVQPGDQVLIGYPKPFWGSFGQMDAVIGVATVNFPGPFEGAAFDAAWLGDWENYAEDGGTTDVEIFPWNLHQDGATFDLLGLAEDDTEQLLAYSYVSDVAIGDGAPVIDLPDWRTDWDLVDFAFQDLPADASQLYLQLFYGHAGLSFAHLNSWAEPEGGSGLIEARFPHDFADRASYAASMLVGSGQATVLRYDQPIPEGGFTIQGPDVLPVPQTVTAEVAGDGRIEVDWIWPAAPVGADALSLDLEWPWDPENPTVQHVWRVLAPPESDLPLRLPELPVDLAPWVPASDAPIRAIVELADKNYIRGYDQVPGLGLEASMNINAEPPPGPLEIRQSSAENLEQQQQ